MYFCKRNLTVNNDSFIDITVLSKSMICSCVAIVAYSRGEGLVYKIEFLGGGLSTKNIH